MGESSRPCFVLAPGLTACVAERVHLSSPVREESVTLRLGGVRLWRENGLRLNGVDRMLGD